jgi:DNA-binding CsgD family transcriptional regulator
MTPRDRLTCKEIEVATLVWQGLTNREIGKLTGTTEQVVKNHLRSAFDKLGVWSRLELAMYVASHGGKSWAEESSRQLAPASDGTVLRENRIGASSRTTQL